MFLDQENRAFGQNEFMSRIELIGFENYLRFGIPRKSSNQNEIILWILSKNIMFLESKDRYSDIKGLLSQIEFIGFEKYLRFGTLR